MDDFLNLKKENDRNSKPYPEDPDLPKQKDPDPHKKSLNPKHCIKLIMRASYRPLVLLSYNPAVEGYMRMIRFSQTKLRIKNRFLLVNYRNHGQYVGNLLNFMQERYRSTFRKQNNLRR